MNTSMTINATAMWLLALYQVVAEEQGADPARWPARRRTTSSRSTSRAGRTSSRPARRCG
jgi:methylmalonyl-CoA mutase N-terminal domain/subunit